MSATPRPRPAGRLSAGLFALFVLAPIVEVVLLVLIGRSVGVWPVIGVVLGTMAVGAVLVRHEGIRSWRAIRSATDRGQVPTREVVDAGLVLVGGVLLVLPGVISDVAGLLCLLPFTRALPRRALQRWASGRVGVVGLPTTFGGGRLRGGGTVIPGEVVEPEQAPADGREPPALEGRVLD